MKRSNTFVFVLVLTLAASSSHAGIDISKQIKIDLADPADAAGKCTWSYPDTLTISQDGLGWDGDTAATRDGWIQTTPLAVGLSWRPTTAVSFRVAIHPPAKQVLLDSGHTIFPNHGEVYARYSPDLKHWSSWLVLQRVEAQGREEKKNPGRFFSGQIRVPYRDQSEYRTTLRQYATMDVPWKSDEEAAVKWMLQSRPDFFSQQIPFVGYVQLLFEGGFRGGQRIKSFKADVSYGMGGKHYAPKDRSKYKDRENLPWRYKAKPRAEDASVGVTHDRTRRDS